MTQREQVSIIIAFNEKNSIILFFLGTCINHLPSCCKNFLSIYSNQQKFLSEITMLLKFADEFSIILK